MGALIMSMISFSIVFLVIIGLMESKMAFINYAKVEVTVPGVRC